MKGLLELLTRKNVNTDLITRDLNRYNKILEMSNALLVE
jgi:hypothetical protein